jgi:hypothetical protein
MSEGLFRPLAIIVSLLIFGVPSFLMCRWLWRKGSKH